MTLMKVTLDYLHRGGNQLEQKMHYNTLAHLGNIVGDITGYISDQLMSFSYGVLQTASPRLIRNTKKMVVDDIFRSLLPINKVIKACAKIMPDTKYIALLGGGIFLYWCKWSFFRIEAPPSQYIRGGEETDETDDIRTSEESNDEATKEAIGKPRRVPIDPPAPRWADTDDTLEVLAPTSLTTVTTNSFSGKSGETEVKQKGSNLLIGDNERNTQGVCYHKRCKHSQLHFWNDCPYNSRNVKQLCKHKQCRGEKSHLWKFCEHNPKRERANKAIHKIPREVMVEEAVQEAAELTKTGVLGHKNSSYAMALTEYPREMIRETRDAFMRFKFPDYCRLKRNQRSYLQVLVDTDSSNAHLLSPTELAALHLVQAAQDKAVGLMQKEATEVNMQTAKQRVVQALDKIRNEIQAENFKINKYKGNMLKVYKWYSTILQCPVAKRDLVEFAISLFFFIPASQLLGRQAAESNRKSKNWRKRESILPQNEE